MSRKRIDWNMIAGIIGALPVVLMHLAGGFYLSKNPSYIISHEIVLVGATFLFFKSLFQSEQPPFYKKMTPILISFLIHFAFFALEKGHFVFNPGILYLLLTYFFIILFGNIFIPLYIRKNRQENILEHGIKAFATIKEAYDMGARLREGVRRSYKMNLTLKIDGHPRSPYEIKDIFWISEFYIHRITGSAAIPVKVDKKDHTKVALNFGG